MTATDILLNYWHLNIPALIIALLLAWFHIATNGYKLRRNSWVFLPGVVLFLLVTISPIDYLAHSYMFSAHMIQHIVLLLIVPPLLLAGTDSDWLERMANNKAFIRIGNVLFYPALAWLLGIGSMYAWHIPAVMSSVESSAAVNIIHMILLLIIGLIFIWPVYTPAGFRKLHPLLSSLYLFTACIGCTILGILITFAPAGMLTSHLYGQSGSVMNPFQFALGMPPETDQLTGGLIMWVPACIIYLTNIMIVLARWFNAREAEG